MKRQEAWSLVLEKIPNANLRKHVLAVEAVMRRLAGEAGADEEDWGLAGVLHDIDYGITTDPVQHTLIGARMLSELGLPEEIIEAVKAHNEYHGLPRVTPMAKALFAADALTGLIVAGALIHPEKKLAPLTPEFILKRYKEKSFARGAKRENIETCGELGLSLERFVALGLEAMQGIADDLGL